MHFRRADLLIVIAVIGSLSCLLAPSVSAWRAMSRRDQCANNLRTIAEGVKNYVAVNQYFPAVITRVPRRHGWLASVLPFVEREDLYERYDFSVHWCDPLNADVIATRVPTFECPSASYPGRKAVGETQFSYQGGTLDYLASNRVSPVMVNDGWLPKSTRINGILTRQELCHPSAVRDGLSNTLMLAEVAGTPAKYVLRQREPRPMYGSRGFGAWADAGIYFQGHGHQADGRDWPGPGVINFTNDDGVYSFHREGANLAFGDGAVRFVSQGIDLYIFLAAVTRDNAEVFSAAEIPTVAVGIPVADESPFPKEESND